MNQRDAKREACSIVALHISAYFNVGQPYDDLGRLDNFTDEDLTDANRLHAALCELYNELNRRADTPFKEIEHKTLTRTDVIGAPLRR